MPTAPEDDTLFAPSTDALTAGPPVLGSRYRIVSLLGSGGMGNVYKAHDLELDEVVALKVLRPELVGTADALERFRREVKLARRVTHPNVARVFDIGERHGEKIITMELVDGEPLAAHLARAGRLSPARVAALAEAVCAGLGAAHAAGVVHCDLKPDNVLIAEDGRVVLTDFGIARAVIGERSGGAAGLVGTPAYMAPEQVEGRADLDARTDLYALGVMLFELSTGTPPWTGETVMAVALARLLEPPPDPRELRPDLPPHLSAVVRRCMARRPEDRYESAGAVAAAFASLTLPAGSDPPPLPPPTPPVEASFKSRKRVAVLPFRNAGPPEHDHLAEGLTEELIDVLSVVAGLGVRSRGVVMRYKGIDRDPRDVGRELDVQVVVEGTVRRVGGAARISARLVSVADGMQLWARRFDRPESEILSLSDDTARAIADALALEIRDPARRAEVDPAAMDLYLRARVAYHKLFSDVGGAASVPLYEQALRLAPEEPRILAGYACALARGPAGGPEVDEAIRAAADRALALAPDLADAHLARAAHLYRRGDGPEAMTAALRALRLAPAHAEVHDLVGRLLAETSRLADARRHLTTALTLEPGMDGALVSLARTVELLGDRAEADRLVGGAAQTSSLLPLVARLALWRRDARSAAELLRDLVPDTLPKKMAHLFLTIAASGDAPVELPIPTHHPALRAPRARSFAAQAEVECHAAVGRRDEAVTALVRAAEIGVADLAWVERCPLLDVLRADPRFLAARDVVAGRAEKVVEAYLSDNGSPRRR